MRNSMVIKSFCISIVLIVLSSSSQAQTMYRCGSSYQDKPCANGQQGVVIGSAKAASKNANEANGSSEVLDPACKRRGEEAKKIIWMREAGAQKNDLLAKSSSDEQSQLIADIYAVRGNSNDIRANIEKNCMQESELQRGLGKRLNGNVDADTLQALRKVQQALQDSDKAVVKNSNADKVVNDIEIAPKKRLPCPNLKMQLEIVNANLRAGADVATMQSLQQQKRDLEKDVALSCAK